MDQDNVSGIFMASQGTYAKSKYRFLFGRPHKKTRRQLEQMTTDAHGDQILKTLKNLQRSKFNCQSKKAKISGLWMTRKLLTTNRSTSDGILVCAHGKLKTIRK